jgi:hypothetical protein
MKVCAGISQKIQSDKVPFPLDLAQESNVYRQEDDLTIKRQEYEDRVEKRILAVLSVIVAICLIGTLVSVGGFLFLRYRAKSLTPLIPGQQQQERHLFMASLRIPVTSTLTQESLKVTHGNTTTTTTTKHEEKVNTTQLPTSTPSSTSWFDDLVTASSSVSRDDKEVDESPLIAVKKKFFTPSFVTVRNQWSLEQAPSTKQLFGYVKQAFHYIRNNRYFSQDGSASSKSFWQ